ncbi:DUF2064 domain-containing protein [Gimesia panareensis]|uniref:DUF2064 domain-containing protein n=1 Tax=Gimesia panareensis TaxID=2527978 RepID=UPI00118D3D8C|nr:DUF2064 domain-containing protein [Gimesia panareensis]QDU49396.1 hypothetical protein Pan110_17200 [Gimesia panareensis]
MVPPQGAIAVFVKTPGYSPLKTRLAADIGQQAAEQFHVNSARAVQAVVQAATAQLSVTPFWAVAEPDASDDPLWSDFATISQGAGGLGSRLAFINQRLLEQHDFVIFLGADAPQLPVAYLTEAIDILTTPIESPRFVLGPAADGGFYLFGTTVCLSQELWCSVPYSVSETASVLCKQLEPRGSVQRLPVLTDVDTVQELPLLQQELQQQETLLPEQRQILAWIQGVDFSGKV